MDKNNELISVIMGIYNIPSREILEKAIMSVLNQTYKNIEFIIVDDGSSNGTYEWARDVVLNDDRVQLYQNKKNLGLVKTLNFALSKSRGMYIARMDGDDIAHTDRLEKQMLFLKNKPDVDVVACNVNRFDEDGIWEETKFSENIEAKDFLFNSPIIHPTILARREAFERVNGYRDAWETTRTEDYDIFMRMTADGIKICTLKDVLYDYREDEIAYQKRKYKYRINEMMVRIKGYKLLKLYPRGIPYIIKPLIVGLIPKKIIKFLQIKQRTFERKNS